MSITKRTPRMQKALDDSAKLLYFFALWLRVLNDTIDSLADFLASKQQSNIDFTTKTGNAQLAKQGEYIEQTAYDEPSALPGLRTRSGLWTGAPSWSFFKLVLPAGRWINDVSIRWWSWGSYPCVGRLGVFTEDKGTLIANSDNEETFPAGAPSQGEATFLFSNLYLDAGVYWIRAESLSSDYYAQFFLMYQSTDVYADSEHYYLATYGTPNLTGTYGDAFFKINMQKYLPSGYFLTKRMDLGETPTENGAFQMSFSQPVGTGLNITVYGYANADDTTPAVTYTNAQDGQTLAPYRYWDIYVVMTASASLDQTSIIDLLEILFPKESLLLSEKDKPLLYASADIRDNYRAMLTDVQYTASDLDMVDRVSSGGTISATIEDTTRETIERVISDSPLLNYRAIIYLGADVPGFAETDLLRFFIGTVQAAKYRPKYNKKTYALPLTINNSILELKRKVPQIREGGSVTLADTSINYDRAHCLDAGLDLLRGEADIPARYINTPSFNNNRDLVGPLYVVRRSNSPIRLARRVGTPAADNTGTGTTTEISVNAATKIGNYILICTAAAAGGGTFSVTDPNGGSLGSATVGTVFSDAQIALLINDGAADFVVGDRFIIPVLSPDTRLQSPEPVGKHLPSICIIADGYILPDEDSRITFVRHDVNAAVVATWADEDLVKAGLDAIAIEDVAEIDLGYDTRLYNAAMMAAAWDGSGSDWTAFLEPQVAIDAGSLATWAPGKSEFLRVMEKNLKEASKWLGPEAGYSGKTIATNIALRLVARFAYPPVILSGVVVRNSQFIRTPGDVVNIWSNEFAKFGKRGISTAEVKKFMITSKRLNSKRDRTVFKLMELT